MKKNIFIFLLALALCVASASYSPTSAPDGVDVNTGNQMRWMNGGVSKAHMVGASDGTFYLHAGENGAQILLSPGDSLTQFWYITPYQNNKGVKVTNLLTSIETDSTRVENLHVKGDTVSDGSITADGNMAGANLSGVNTGDQILRTIIAGNMVGSTVDPLDDVYLAPYTSSVGALGNTSVAVPYPGTSKNLCVRTVSSQPNTGNEVVTVYKNGAASTLKVTIPAGAASNVFCDWSNSVSFLAADRFTFQIKNNATLPSAGVAGVSMEYDSQ